MTVTWALSGYLVDKDAISPIVKIHEFRDQRLETALPLFLMTQTIVAFCVTLCSADLEVNCVHAIL